MYRLYAYSNEPIIPYLHTCQAVSTGNVPVSVAYLVTFDGLKQLRSLILLSGCSDIDVGCLEQNKVFCCAVLENFLRMTAHLPND